MQAPLRDRDPRQLGPYRLLGRLGRGGMGTVFLGEDDSGRQVAVKVINAELADDEAFHERFRSEVTAARQVRRFCTAAVLDARLDGEPLYVATEYVSGPSLDAAVKEGGPLRGGDLEALAVNIATALSAIHGAGIVHRDLKPSNVLLSPTGPRVIDFGIARALDASDGPTRTGQFIGTPTYMAPELMNGAEITPAADVFAWGCVVAYAGTGRAPFGAGTIPETINRVTGGEPDLDGLDPALHGLVARSLAKDPAERPSVRQLIQSLTGEDEPPSTPPAVALPAPLPPAPDPETEPEPETALDPAAAGPVAAEPGTVPVTAFESVPATRPVDAPPPGAAEAPPTQPPFLRSPSPASPKPPRSRHRNGLAIGAVAAVVGASALFGVLNLTSDDGGAAGGPPSAPVAADLGKEPPEVDDKVFDDNFSDETSGWKTAATPIWDASYRDRKYELHVLPTTNRTVVDAPVDDVPDSQLIEVKVEHTGGEGGEAGVYCHGQAGGFAFLLREDGRVRIAKLGSTLTDLATGTATDLRGNDDRIQAACLDDGSGMSLGLWVNGEHVASASAEAPDGDPGSSGVIVHRPEGAEGHPEATFDNFALCSV